MNKQVIIALWLFMAFPGLLNASAAQKYAVKGSVLDSIITIYKFNPDRLFKHLDANHINPQALTLNRVTVKSETNQTSIAFLLIDGKTWVHLPTTLNDDEKRKQDELAAKGKAREARKTTQTACHNNSNSCLIM